MKQMKLLHEKKYAYRKTARPISTRQWMHVVFKSHRPVLRMNHVLVRKVFQEMQIRFGVRLKSIAIMENHIHVLIRVPSRDSFANAMRFFAGALALKIGGGKLWSQRLWSRLVRFGKDLVNTDRYIDLNPDRAGILSEIDISWIRKGMLQTRYGW